MSSKLAQILTLIIVIGFTGCIIALIGECITVSIFSRTGESGAASAAVFFLFLHVAIFTCCCDATSYVYAAEIFPTPVRAKGLSVSVSGLFFATIIFTTAAPTAFADIGWKYYLIFIGLTSIITVYAYFTFPEVCSNSYPKVYLSANLYFKTRKRSLEEIQEIFGDEVVNGVSLDSPEQASRQESTSKDKEGGILVEASKTG